MHTPLLFPVLSGRLLQALISRSAGAVLLTAVFLLPLLAVSAAAETRTLRMYYGHSKESATITFKKNGRYVKSGLRKANRFLRDWRRKEPTKMDPALLDLVWEVYQKSGSRKPIQVISGYRSPKTNRMLRRRGRKVAKTSQHTMGKALDFYLPDVSVKKLRALGLQAHRGGVGYYRGSFVHLDTGRVRHWPRMSRRQLAAVFPRGRTIHVPSNGKPLRGYKTALANLKKGLNANGTSRKTKVRSSLIARIFSGSGNGGDEGEGNTAALGKKPTTRVKKPAPEPKPKAPAVVAAKPAPAKKGPDPFASELTALARKDAVEKAKRDAADKEAVEAKLREAEVAKLQEAEEQVTLAALEPTRIARPRLRPRPASAEPVPAANTLTPAPEIGQPLAVEPAATQLALAPQTGLASGSNRLAPVGATELALATGKLVNGVRENVLRPSADIPSDTTPQQAAVPVPPAPSATIPVLRREPVPEPTVEVAALAPENDPTRMAALKSRITQALTRQRLRPTQTATSVPSLRDTLNVPVPTLSPVRADQSTQIASAPAATRLTSPLPAPRRVGGFDKTPSNQALAGIATGSGVAMRSELSLGDLDSRSVTRWAVATSTRTGVSASLVAPDYSQGTKRAVPASIYSVGFEADTSPLRADRFTGQAMQRVAFATFRP